MTETVQHVIAQWTAKPEHREQVREILREVARRSQQESWCISFTVLESAAEPGAFVLLEKYFGADGHQRHMAAPTFQELVLGQAIALLASRSVNYYTAVYEESAP